MSDGCQNTDPGQKPPKPPAVPDYQTIAFQARHILNCGHIDNVLSALATLNARYNDALARIATLECQPLACQPSVLSEALPNQNTKTRALIAQQRAQWDAQRAQLARVIREEFPVGTKVRWMHGANYIAGTVVDTARWEWSDDVTVRNSKSGKDFRKEAKDLELLPN